MILLIDNYDSFTYNLAQALGVLGQELKVFRNDAIELNEIEDLAPQALVISPGPGRPKDSGITCPVIERFAGRIPILGVCLGNQAIGQVFGSDLVRGAKAGARQDIGNVSTTGWASTPGSGTPSRPPAIIP